MVAARTLADYPLDILEQASIAARRRCRHHGQIVPAIVEEADRLVERAAVMRRAEATRRRIVAPPPALPAPPLRQADVDQMPAELQRVGLACGALVERPDGTIAVAPR